MSHPLIRAYDPSPYIVVEDICPDLKQIVFGWALNRASCCDCFLYARAPQTVKVLHNTGGIVVRVFTTETHGKEEMKVG